MLNHDDNIFPEFWWSVLYINSARSCCLNRNFAWSKPDFLCRQTLRFAPRFGAWTPMSIGNSAHFLVFSLHVWQDYHHKWMKSQLWCFILRCPTWAKPPNHPWYFRIFHDIPSPTLIWTWRPKKRPTNMDVHLVKTSKFSLTRTWSAQNFANKDVVHLVKTIKI